MKQRIKNITLSIISFLAWAKIRYRLATMKMDQYIEMKSRSIVTENFTGIIEDIFEKVWNEAERHEQVTMLHKRIKGNMKNYLHEYLRKY